MQISSFAKVAMSSFIVLLAAGCNSTKTDIFTERVDSTTKQIQETGNINPTTTATTPAPVSSEVGVKTITVKGNNFAFIPSEIKVNKGDKVRIIFENTGGFHDWVIDEFNARTKQISDGATETIEFIADKTGTYEYYCSVGKHRQMGMKGKLIVQ